MVEPSILGFRLFPKLTSLNPKAKEILQPIVNIYEKQIVESKAAQLLIQNVALKLHRVFYFPLMFFFPYYLSKLFSLSFSFWGWLFIYLVYIFCTLFLVGLVFLPYLLVQNTKWFSMRTRELIRSKIFLWAFPVIFLIGYVVWSQLLQISGTPSPIFFSIFSALLFQFPYLLLASLAVFISLPVVYFGVRERRKRYLAALVVERLIAVLHMVENPPQARLPEYSSELVKNLEYIAQLLEDSLYRNQRLEDENSNAI